MIEYFLVKKHLLTITRYVASSNPKNWSDISKGLRLSMSDSQMDVIAQVHLSPNFVSLHPTYRMLNISLEDALKLNPALSTIPGITTKSTLRPEAPSFVPQPKSIPDSGQQTQTEPSPTANTDDSTLQPNDSELQDVDIEGMIDLVEDDNSEDDAELSGGPSVDVTIPLIPSEVNEPSPQELKARKLLLVTCSRWLLKKSKSEGLDAHLQRSYEQCLDIVRSRNWTHDSYRCLFLGPLPHALVCLQSVTSQILADKAQIKKSFSTSAHEKLEEAKSQYDKIMYVFPGTWVI
jgi:hypothetical protein